LEQYKVILSKDEAICLVLEFSKNKEVSSPTKLNKLLARLNLHFVPVDINFSLNKFGSFSADLSGIQETDYYSIASYNYKERTINKFSLKPKGEQLFKETIKQKLDEIFTEQDFNSLKSTINHLSSLNAAEISDNEHKKLLIDVENRFKLQQKLNETSVEIYDLYQTLEKIPEDSIAALRLKALIEYCYFLMNYLKEIRFKHLPEEEYDFEAYMFDYYFLYNISRIIPFLDKQISKANKDSITINKYYQYFVNSVRENYPFSLENKDLKELIVQ